MQFFTYKFLILVPTIKRLAIGLFSDGIPVRFESTGLSEANITLYPDPEFYVSIIISGSYVIH